jgi:rod shape-determining protein MreD
MILINIISFYLEGILSRFTVNSLFVPLFTLISLIIIYPFLFCYKKDYYILCFILGLLYDISYTSTIFLNAFIFLLIGFIIVKLNLFITNNKFNVIILSIFIILIYRIITYIVLIMIGYLKFNINDLINSILNSIIINIIYSYFLFIIIDKISTKRNIVKNY